VFSVPTRQQLKRCQLFVEVSPPSSNQYTLPLSLSASLLINNGFGVVLLAYHLFPFPHRFFSLNVLPGIHSTFFFFA